MRDRPRLLLSLGESHSGRRANPQGEVLSCWRAIVGKAVSVVSRVLQEAPPIPCVTCSPQGQRHNQNRMAEFERMNMGYPTIGNTERVAMRVFDFFQA